MSPRAKNLAPIDGEHPDDLVVLTIKLRRRERDRLHARARAEGYTSLTAWLVDLAGVDAGHADDKVRAQLEACRAKSHRIERSLRHVCGLVATPTEPDPA
ncbi:MAG: hypothetical protein ABMB14_20430 [Myxococcota bacterium]